MSVTISQQPDGHTPAYNPQIFVGLSTQIAQPNFNYEVVITDLVSSVSKTYMIPARPDGYCTFDAQPYVESFMTHYCPINVFGFQLTSSSRKIRVNIGESYGSTPASFSGTNIDYIAWNGVLDFLDVPGYDSTDFVYVAGINENQVYLTNRLDDITFEDRSNLLYVLTSASGDFQTLEIQLFDNNGAGINTAQIPNPYYNSSNYREKYLAIDVGWKGLTNIASGLVTLGYPIDLSNCAYYDLYDNSVTGNPPAGTQNLIKRIYVKCEPAHTVYTVHFLAKNGGFETIHFHLKSEFTLKREQTNYNKLPYEFSGGTYTHTRSSPLKKTLSSSRTEILRLNTDWLDEEHANLYEQILDAPVGNIYLDLGPDLDYAQLEVITDSYKRYDKFGEPLFQLQMDFAYTHTNHRQK